MVTYKILGITDDKTSCEKCGKTNLKRTVAISIDGADPVFYGTTCAARAIANNSKAVRATAENITELANAIAYAQKWQRHYAAAGYTGEDRSGRQIEGQAITKAIASAITTKFAVSARATGYRVIALSANDGKAWVNWQGDIIDDPKNLF